MIKFLTARAGRKQSESIYTNLQSLPESEKAFVLVPDQFTYETERKILKNKKTDLQTEVLSLKRLSYRLESECVTEEVNVLSSEASAILVKRAVDLAADELTVFKSVCRTQGFCEEALEFMDEMKKGGIDLKDLRVGLSDKESIKQKIDDITKIYEKYISLLPDDYISSDDYFSFIAQRAESSRTIADAHFYFDGFYSFDKSEYPLICLIMRKAKSVTFSFITDNEKFFDCSQITIKELYNIITEYGLEYTVERNDDASLLSSEEIFLEQHLMSYDRVTFTGETDRINLIEAKDKFDECDYVAGEINRLIREEKYRYSDIQIICADKSYFEVLKNTLSRHKIEHFIDENRSVSSTSAVRAFLYITDMLDNSCSTTEMIAFAKSGFSLLTDQEYMLLENYILEMGIKGRMWEKEFTKNNSEESYDMAQINALREKLILPILKIRSNISGYKNVSEFTSRLIDSLDEIHFEETIQSYIDEFVLTGQHENANIYAQINNKILLILSQLDGFFGEEYLSPKEIYDILSFALSSCKVGVIPSRVDTVSIGDVLRSLNKQSRIMFVMGSAEGIMPSASYNQPILNDRERKSITGFQVKNNSDYLRKRENFVYYTFLCSPKERLYISYSHENESYPSVMYQRISEIFPEANRPDVSESLCMDDMIDTKDYAFYKMTDLISKYNSDELTQTQKSSLCAMISSLDDDMTQSYLKIIKDGYAFDNDSGIKNKRSYLSLLPDPFVTSVSMLETYGRCPFSFFMDYVLRPKERRIRRVKTTDLGSVLHKIVEDISAMIIDGRMDVLAITDEEIKSVTENVANKVLGEYKDGIISGVTHGKYLYRKLITSALGAVKEIISQLKLSDFVITESETSFGPKDKYSPITLTTKDEKTIFVRGIIDRIDFAALMGGKYLKIIDYKSSKRKFDLSKCGGGISLQLPAYALAVKDEDSEVAGVFYFKLNSTPVSVEKQMSMDEIKDKVKKERKLNGLTLKDKDVVLALDRNAEEDSFISNVEIKKDSTFRNKDGLFTKEEFHSLLEITKQNMTETAENILEGNIPVLPYRFGRSENACTYCEYQDVCKFSSGFEKNSFRRIEKITPQMLSEGGDE